MNRLKKDWDNTEIAPQILWQTRNRAWLRLQRSKRQRQFSLAAALAALAALLFLWVRSPAGLPSPAPVEVASANPHSPSAAAMANPEPPSTGQAEEIAPERPPAGETAQYLSAARGRAQHSAAKGKSGQAEESAAKQPALNSAPAAPSDHELDRLVMNFRLPQSGVRMIWIKQRIAPPPSGGTG